ncbi:MAG: TIM barrel protein [Candidatus Nanoarchaeia archaeon]
MAIYVGPGGVPISSPDRSTIGGIRHCAKLGLNAMEVEFVRGVNMSPATAVEAGKVAKELGIRLSVHAPYYINLLSNKKATVRASIVRILDSMHRGMLMGADAVAVHAAYYGDLSPVEALNKMKTITEEIFAQAEKKGIKGILLGYETMGKTSQWGSFEEILELYDTFKQKLTPYLDWGHIYVRNQGHINYEEILDKLQNIGLKHINSHFNCVKYSKTAKAWVDVHDLLKTKNPNFESLAKLLIKRKVNITLISESPVLEQDALEMKKILENCGYKFD